MRAVCGGVLYAGGAIASVCVCVCSSLHLILFRNDARLCPNDDAMTMTPQHTAKHANTPARRRRRMQTAAAAAHATPNTPTHTHTASCSLTHVLVPTNTHTDTHTHQTAIALRFSDVVGRRSRRQGEKVHAIE